MPVRQRDPNDPDFPHGSKSGARAGCRNGFLCPATPTCAQVTRALVKAREQRGDFTTHYQSESLIPHLSGFVRQGWALKAIAAASGVFYGTISDILAGRRPVITAATAAALRDVTEEAMIERWGGDIPIHRVAWIPGSLYANGWRIEDIARRMRPRRHTATIRPIVYRINAHVDRGLYDDLVALHDESGHLPGDSRQARLRAALLGYRTPEEYAPDGKLWEDGKRRNERLEGRWARRSKQAKLHLDIARLSLRYGLTPTEIITRVEFCHVQERALLRMREALGLKWSGGKPEPGQDERIAHILDVVDRWLEDQEPDPHPFCVELGLMTDPRWTDLDNIGKPKLEAA